MILRHGALYLGTRVATGVLSLAIVGVFTRLLSPEQYGVYALVMATATMSSAILFQWIVVSAARLYARYSQNPEALLTAILKCYWVSAACGALIGLGAAVASNLVTATLVAMVVGMTLVQGRYDIALQIANARKLPLTYGLSSCIRGFLTLLIGSILAMLINHPASVIVAVLVATLVAASIPKAFRGLRMFSAVADKDMAYQIARYGLPLTITFLAIMVVSLSDRLFIASLLGASHVGPYAAAYDFVQQSIGTIMNVAYLAAYPVLVGAYENGDGEKLQHDLLWLSRVYIAIGLPAVIGLSVLSEQVATVLFGTNFSAEAASLIPWIAMIIFVSGWKAFYLDVPLQLARRTKHQAAIALLMAALNICLNFILIPLYGVYGAVWAALTSFSFAAFLTWLLATRYLSLPFAWLDAAKVLAACTLMVAVLYFRGIDLGVLSLLVSIVTGATAYAVTAYFFNIAGCRTYVRRALLQRSSFAQSQR